MKHLRAYEAELAALAKPGDTPAEKVLMALNKQHLFRTCHALAKNARPFTDYTWLCKLDAQKGVDIGTTYRNDKAAQTFTYYIGEVLRLEMQAHFNEAHFFAPMMDGSTDKSVIEQEIAYVRVAKQGTVKEQFVSLEHVEKADAAGLIRALDRAMINSAGQPGWWQKVVAIGTDGASVNTGKKTGVIKRLRDDILHLVGIRCMAYKLELALNDATRIVGVQTSTNHILLSLYLFYHSSSLNRSNLKTSYST